MSIQDEIINYCHGKGWIFGGVVEDHMRAETKHKASYAARECRKLAETKLLERQEARVNGKKVVQYRHLCRGNCGDFVDTITGKVTHKRRGNIKTSDQSAGRPTEGVRPETRQGEVQEVRDNGTSIGESHLPEGETPTDEVGTTQRQATLFPLSHSLVAQASDRSSRLVEVLDERGRLRRFTHPSKHL